MNPEIWRQVEAAHERWEDLPPADRAAYLQGLNDEVRDWVGRIVNETAPYLPAIERAPLVEILGDPQPDELRPGEIIDGRFRILSRVGSGGMGTVYKAEQIDLSSIVALKFLHPRFSRDQRYIELLKNEVRLGREVIHRNVCKIHDLYNHEGYYFLSMEFVEGEDLECLLKKVGRFTPEKTRQIADQLCDGVSAIHEKCIHRDLKPSNVMIDGKGNVRITDFGLALETDTSSVLENGGWTWAYAAPEQIEKNEVTLRSDLFSLGLVLHELHTGRRVFQGDTLTELQEERRRPIPAPSDVVSRLRYDVDKAVLHCLKHDSSERPPDAETVRKELEGWPSPLPGDDREEKPLPARTAFLLLGGVTLGLTLVLLCSDAATWFGRANPKKPGVLQEKSELIIKKLGYGNRSPRTDVAFGFMHNIQRTSDLVELNHDHAIMDASGQSARVHPWYRQSPRPLVANHFFPVDYTRWFQFTKGRVSPSNPSPFEPGMVSLTLDPQGELLTFIAIPDGASDWTPIGPSTWHEWLKAVVPEEVTDGWQCKPDEILHTIPAVPMDQKMVWIKDGAGGDERIEAAAWKGRPTYFARVDAVVTGSGQASQLPSEKSSRWISYSLQKLYWSGFALVGMVIALRNWQLGRGDIAGAAKLAFSLFCLFLASGLLCTSHVTTAAETNLWDLNVAKAVWLTFVACVCYLALEPYVRKDLPHALTSWHRLLRGRRADQRIGRDVLIGILGATFAESVQRIGIVADLRLGLATAPIEGGMLDVTISPAMFLSEAFYHLGFSIVISFSFLLFYWALWTVAVRRARVMARWVAFALGSLTLTIMMLYSAEGNAFAIARLNFTMAVYVLVLVRFGFLAIVAWHFTKYVLAFPMTADSSRWYFESGLCAVGILLGLACYGCYLSQRRGAILSSTPKF